jgi:hypothetical protein
MFMPSEFYLGPKTFTSTCVDGLVSSKCVTMVGRCRLSQ